MAVEPSIVGPGEMFNVRNTFQGPLPAKLNCSIASTATGQVTQWNVLDVSGTVSLNLKEKYGALEVEACNEQRCIEEGCFEYTFSNVGTGDMRVVSAERSVNGLPPAELVEFVNPNPLSPTESATVEEKIPIDYCQTSTETVSIIGEGDNLDGGPCLDEDVFEIPIAPVCIIDSNLTCTDKATGLDCDDIPKVESSVCDCAPDCATEVRFVYTAQSCPIDPPYGCVQTGLPSPTGARVVVTTGANILFNGDIPIGGEAVLSNNGACMPDEFNVLISDPGSNQVKQTITVNTGCSANGVPLGTTFGAVDFAGYTCQDGTGGNCFADAEFKACAMNTGPIPLTIIDYTLDVNGAVTNILDDGPVTIITGEAYCP